MRASYVRVSLPEEMFESLNLVVGNTHVDSPDRRRPTGRLLARRSLVGLRPTMRVAVVGSLFSVPIVTTLKALL
jgi:hypothetical protein